MKQPFNPHSRTLLRLSEIIRLIKEHRIMIPPPSRQTLAEMCLEGTFETLGDEPTSFGWLVYEDSFWKWAENLERAKPTKVGRPRRS